MNIDDPTPPHDYGDDRAAAEQAERDALDPDSPIARIVALDDAGLLTARQAEVFVLRDLERHSRKEVADMAGISPNVVDKHLYAARSKLDAARETIDLLDD